MHLQTTVKYLHLKYQVKACLHVHRGKIYQRHRNHNGTAHVLSLPHAAAYSPYSWSAPRPPIRPCSTTTSQPFRQAPIIRGTTLGKEGQLTRAARPALASSRSTHTRTRTRYAAVLRGGRTDTRPPHHPCPPSVHLHLPTPLVRVAMRCA